MSDMRQWLASIGLGEYWRVFDENAVDLRVLPSLTEGDLKELGVKLGHRRLLQQAIASLDTVCDSGTAARSSLAGDAERRQLTVMFCDLVGSTELSQRLDPEELRHVMSTYQDACKRAVERFEGYVARYMGDGVLAYFGYPQAHEDDAERAVRAALELVDATTSMSDQAVRVGIATGPVVVGDLIGEASSQERAAGFSANDTLDVRLSKLEALLDGPDARQEEDVPLIAALLSLDSSARYRPLSLAPAEQRERTLGALTHQLARMSLDGPVLLLFEDIHWVDPSTLDLLHRWVERAVELPIMILVTFRPEFDESWSGQAHVTLMALNRLPRQECLAMLDHMPGVAGLDAATLDEIVSHTDGVPLFIEELTRTVLESAMETQDGSDAGAPFAVPSTLQDSLMARLDRLPAGKPIAQAASVVCRDFDRALLCAIGDLEDADVTAGIEQLVASALILRRSGEHYQFKHALVRDAAYASLLKVRRADLHAHIVHAMSEVFPVRGEAEPEVVAHHCERAAAWQEAARWWLRAATKAGGRAASEECVRHLQRAVSALGHLGEDEHPRQSVEARLELVAALRVAEGMEQALGELDAAEALATRHGLDDLRSRVHHQRGNVLFPLGRTNECLMEHRRALGLARETGRTELEAMALGGIGDGEYARGRMRSASRAFTECVQLARGKQLPLIVAPNLAMKGFVSTYTFSSERGPSACLRSSSTTLQRAVLCCRRPKLRSRRAASRTTG